MFILDKVVQWIDSCISDEKKEGRVDDQELPRKNMMATVPPPLEASVRGDGRRYLYRHTVGKIFVQGQSLCS
jgi:hypothetical protein